jgi:hypothetical protein
MPSRKTLRPSQYADKVKTAVNTALEEEAVLITVAKIYHAE